MGFDGSDVWAGARGVRGDEKAISHTLKVGCGRMCLQRGGVERYYLDELAAQFAVGKRHSWMHPPLPAPYPPVEAINPLQSTGCRSVYSQKATPPPPPSQERARVLFTYAAADNTELSLTEGEASNVK